MCSLEFPVPCRLTTNAVQFYSFSAILPSDTSISSFTVHLTLTSAATETYDNNGAGFPITDNVMLLKPQSCVTAAGKLTVQAAIRSDRANLPTTLDLSLRVPRQGVIVPALQAASVNMANGATLG